MTIADSLSRSPSLLSIAHLAMLCPATTVIIIILIAVYAQNKPSILDPSPLHIRKMSYNYHEAVGEKKYLNVAISLFYHKNFTHLIFSISILWGCIRYVEMEKGTVFVIGYSCVLGVVSSGLCLSICHGISMNPTNILFRILQPELEQTRINGFCGIALAWTAYQSLSYSRIQTLFWLFGLVPMHILMTPTFLLAVASTILPKSILYSTFHLCGVISGFLLVGGAIAILPNFYWNTCFYFDIVVLMIYMTCDSYRLEGLHAQGRVQEAADLIERDIEGRHRLPDEDGELNTSFSERDGLLGAENREAISISYIL